ncbi:class II histocompatibility antigen, B-L beta chain-like [Phyllobates terribilis]|uniref:class II histocompatibility antigen, B-L beta chain-like n=1 Tax=Phyllobates terribilis TaxID=111132 RepID=UPI003CCB3B82
MKLHCQVYGFHPRAVDVKWMMNGEDEVPPFETTHVLPNPDGTYQIRVSAEVTPKEGNRYSCKVNHSSLEEPLSIVWGRNVKSSEETQ